MGAGSWLAAAIEDRWRNEVGNQNVSNHLAFVTNNVCRLAARTPQIWGERKWGPDVLFAKFEAHRAAGSRDESHTCAHGEFQDDSRSHESVGS